MGNKNFLIIVIVILAGIIGVMSIQLAQDDRSSIEKIGDSINETAEEIGDEIDDNTDAR